MFAISINLFQNPIGINRLKLIRIHLNRKTCTDVPDKLLIISRKKDIRVRQLLSKNSLNEHDMVSHK